MSKRPPLQQISALPFCISRKSVDVLLVTSRGRGHWILPKGWPSEGLEPTHTAAQEAHEEAGLIGPVHHDPIGSFPYKKFLKRGRSVDCRVVVYPMLVVEQRVRWREKAQRSLMWVPIRKASKKTQDKGLSRLLDMAAANNARHLRSLAVKMRKAPRLRRPIRGLEFAN